MPESTQVGNGSDWEKKFQLLETKILAAIDHINKLKRTNAELQDNLAQSISRSEMLEQERDRLKSQLMEAEQWKEQVEKLTRLKVTVAGKIENLLARLEEVHIGSE